MSATGRNLVGNERRKDDFYETPRWCTRVILPHLKLSGPILDPCCGNGAILDEIPFYCGIGIEIDEVRCETAKRKHIVTLGNALDWSNSWPLCGTLITNPPYSSAESFIRRAIAQGFNDTGDCAFLLRLNFLGSQERARLHTDYPSDIFVLPKRPSFTGSGTDMTEYAWFVWGPNRGNRWKILEIK